MSESVEDRRRFHATVTHWMHRAFELGSEPGRAERLREELRDQPDVLAEVLALLRSEGDLGAFLDAPALGGVPLEPAHFAEPVERLGPYRVLRPIGRGGMGTVYLAERADREYEKRVAIKVADRLGSPEIQRRLKAERTILAQLEHPNIARLYDAGTVRGIPYFVMELVEGVPIDRYCEAERLDLGARLDLFRRVCRAVELAHRNLIVHRDLKPGNILVAPDGEPKLLDFGLAKLLEPGEERQATAAGPLRPLTPDYASPEQLRGEPITVASDVYSLGVVLHRMLTGALPRRLEGLGPDDVARALASEPPPASADPDVAAIVRKALEPDRGRRYGSVGELLDDLERHRDDRPVTARPPTLPYRLRKLVRRRRAAVAWGAAILVVIAVSLALLLTQMREVAFQRNEARSSQARAEQLSALLVDILRQADPGRSGGEGVTLREALDRGAALLDAPGPIDPELRAMQLEALASIYREVGAVAPALDFSSRAVALREAQGRPLSLGRSLVQWGSILSDADAYGEAEDKLARGLKLLEWEPGLDPGELGEASLELGWARQQLGRYAEAENDLRRGVEILTREHGAGDPRVASAEARLGRFLWVNGRLDEAEQRLAPAVEVLRASGDAFRAELGLALENLGVLAMVRGDLASAASRLEESLAARTETLGRAGVARADSLFLLARVLRARGELTRAEELAHQALELAPAGSTRVMAVETLAGILLDRGDVAAAERDLRDLLRRLREGGFEDSPVAARVLAGLAEVERRKGDGASAARLLEESLALRERAFPPGHFLVAESRLALGRCLAELGRSDEAAVQLSLARDELATTFGAGDARVRQASEALARVRR